MLHRILHLREGSPVLSRRIVYSIYYRQYSNLTCIEGEGRGLVLRLVAVSDDSGREQETLYYYSDTAMVYIVIMIRDSHSYTA